MKKIAINGFGRIGRLTLRALAHKPNLKVVAINDLADTYTLAHLLRYDSAHGTLQEDVKANENFLFFGKKAIAAYSIPDVADLPWKKLGVDIVLECTGRNRTTESLNKHLKAGAKKVILSAPAKEDVKTIVMGVNEQILTPSDSLISNASCTTNCLAPMVKILHDTFGIAQGILSTVHAYTADQNIQDGPHKGDLRRARAAAYNIVPTTTGAAKAIGMVIPELKDKLEGGSIRVPVINGSLTELICLLDNEVTLAKVHRAFLKASQTYMHDYLQYSDEPLVSTDIIGNANSCIYDSQLTRVMGKMVKVVGWYDNEFGYANRMADIAEYVAKLK